MLFSGEEGAASGKEESERGRKNKILCQALERSVRIHTSQNGNVIRKTVSALARQVIAKRMAKRPRDEDVIVEDSRTKSSSPLPPCPSCSLSVPAKVTLSHHSSYENAQTMAPLGRSTPPVEVLVT